jgi:hypothetical protein
MQFLQEFSIEHEVIFIQTEPVLGFVWEFLENGALYVPGWEIG